MRSLYPGVSILEYNDDSNDFKKKVYDPEGQLVLHIYDFDPLLEGGDYELCKGQDAIQD